MYYEKMSDMFLDNRNGVLKRLKELGANKEIMEEALNGYDWAVRQALETREAYNIFKDAVIKGVGEEKTKEIESNVGGFDILIRMSEATRDYYEDVNAGKRVGYSALEEE